jgi:serine/threonine-protein kinase RsbW
VPAVNPSSPGSDLVRRPAAWLGSRLEDIALVAIVAAAYAAGYELASNWFSAPDQGASFFPPAGITLAALVLLPRRQWPLVLGAAAATEIVLDLANGAGLLASAGYALANVAEPLTGALLVLALVARLDLRRTRDLSVFLGCAVVIAPIVGAAIAASTFVFIGEHSGWARFAFEWWCGDGLGVLVVGGALLSLRPLPLLPARRIAEGLLLGVGIALSTMAVFEFGWFAFVYLPVALLVVLAFRVGTTGVALASAAAAFLAAGSTAEAKDFWQSVDVSPANRILYLQLAMGVIIASVLALAAEIAERERIAADLARAESERAVALDRALLADGEQRARIQAESLGRSAALLARSGTVEEVADAAVSAMADWGASQSTFFVVDGERLLLRAARGLDPDTRAAYSVIALDVDAPSTEAVRSCAPVVVRSRGEFARRYPLFAEDHAIDTETLAAFPVVANQEVRGVVTARLAQPGWLTEDRFDLLAALADQAAVALERASLLRREREARARAEVLETHATQLATAASVREVARTTMAVASTLGTAGAVVHLLVEERLEFVDSLGELEGAGHDAARELAAGPIAEAVRTGRPVEISTGEELALRFPQVFDRLDGHGLESLTAIPLERTRGDTIGVLTLAAHAPNWLSESDRRQLLTSLAGQCGLALERAELQAEADSAAADAALLAHLGDVLERATGLADRAHALVSALAAHLRTLAAVHDLDDAEEPRLLAQASSDQLGADVGERELAHVAREALTANGPVAARDGVVELLSVPLRARSRALGVLTLGVHRDVRTRITTVLLQRVATRAALAFDNALLYEQERDVSHSLQMGLLGGDLATPPSAPIATAYRPGTTTLEVGGDWYDAFTLPNGNLALLVGDVVGHGLEAAVAMGQLRGAVRALGPMGSPSAVLEGLDIFVAQLPAAAMATLAYAELNLDDGQIVYACAGHPPPLRVAADGTATFLWEGRSTPLGSSFSEGRTEASSRLEPGDTIVLYTDGLVERRTRGITTGLDLLLEVAGRHAAPEPAALVERILDALLVDASAEDDVCLLAVGFERRARRFVRTFPAMSVEVATMRHELAAWLEGVELDPDCRRDVVLATSEAAANSAEHAYRFDGTSPIAVEAWVADERLHVSVSDHGVWRPPRADPDRGRGQRIIAALMRDVTVETGNGSTVVRMSVPLQARVPA